MPVGLSLRLTQHDCDPWCRLSGWCRYDLYVEVKLWQDAADTALKMKDRNRLVEVQSLCHMPGLQRAIEEQLAKL